MGGLADENEPQITAEPLFFKHPVCAQYGRSIGRYKLIPKGASPLQASWYMSVASGKVVHREVWTEESQTANSGTDGQKLHTEANLSG